MEYNFQNQKVSPAPNDDSSQFGLRHDHSSSKKNSDEHSCKSFGLDSECID